MKKGKCLFSDTVIWFKIKAIMPGKDKKEQAKNLKQAKRMFDKGLFITSLHEAIKWEE